MVVFLADKRALLCGNAGDFGIDDLDDLAERIDTIRQPLLRALHELGQASPIRGSSSCPMLAGRLLTATYRAAATAPQPGRLPEASGIEPVVDQLRRAFLLAANHVAAVYDHPAARRLAERLTSDPEPAAPSSG